MDDGMCVDTGAAFLWMASGLAMAAAGVALGAAVGGDAAFYVGGTGAVAGYAAVGQGRYLLSVPREPVLEPAESAHPDAAAHGRVDGAVLAA